MRIITKPLMRVAAKTVKGTRDGPRRQSGNEFQAAGPATEKARRPNMERQCRGIRTADGSRRTADAKKGKGSP